MRHKKHSNIIIKLSKQDSSNTNWFNGSKQ